MVDRIGIETLKKLKKGELSKNATCIVKFYSQECHLCHALKDYFIDIAESYEDKNENLFFFAFNVDDVEGDIQKFMKKINGVPTIVSFRGGPNRNVKINILEDPEKPNEKTWYYVKDIRKFIESNL